LEVYDFVYGFLCGHINGVDQDSFSRSWDVDSQDRRVDWYDEQSDLADERMDPYSPDPKIEYTDHILFTHELAKHLSPPDVLELPNRRGR
jgi:hypothetical protein